MLVTYVPVGDPELRGEDHLAVYADAGADVLEIGIPAANPHLDGPVVASSMERALDSGFRIERLAEAIAEWRSNQTSPPMVVWMTYSATDLGDLAGHVEMGALDGLLIVDGELEPASSTADPLNDAALGTCTFVGWNPDEAELRCAAQASGYVMMQARPGLTGRGGPDRGLASSVGRLRPLIGSIPLVGGFGIRSQGDIATVIEAGCDGVVVGSRCIEALRSGPAALSRTISTLRDALDEELDRHVPGERRNR